MLLQKKQKTVATTAEATITSANFITAVTATTTSITKVTPVNAVVTAVETSNTPVTSTPKNCKEVLLSTPQSPIPQRRQTILLPTNIPTSPQCITSSLKHRQMSQKTQDLRQAYNQSRFMFTKRQHDTTAQVTGTPWSRVPTHPQLPDPLQLHSVAPVSRTVTSTSAAVPSCSYALSTSQYNMEVEQAVNSIL